MKTNSKLFSIVIECQDILNNKVITHKEIQNYLSHNTSAIKFYAFIQHIDTSSKHFHLCLALYNEYQPKTIINDLAKYLEINKCLVQVDISRNFMLSVQYLTHKNDSKKYQYHYSEIYTNNFPQLEDLYFRNINIFDLDFNTLYNIIIENDYNIKAIYSELGLTLSLRYRNIINDIVKNRERRVHLKND